jgi:two-component system response regulator VicR
MPGERVLLVEDEPAVARGLQYGLERAGYDVLWASTGEEALQMAYGQNPDLILLDIRLPDISGFEVLRQLRADNFRQPILVLTARDEPTDKVLGLELGADDYVVKPYNLRELIARIHALLRRAYGEFAESEQSERLSFGELEIDLEQLQVRRAGEVIPLTSTEFRLLYHLASRPNRPIRRQALIEAVWGYANIVGSERTVDVHIRHLREKIEPDPAHPRRIITVRGVGYKFTP